MVDFKKRLPSNISGLALIIITAVVVFGIVWVFKNSEEYQSFTSYITGKIEQQSKAVKFLPKDSFLVLQIDDSQDADNFIEKSLDSSVNIFGISLTEFNDVFSINTKQDIAISLVDQDGKVEIIIAARIYNDYKYQALKEKLSETEEIKEDMFGDLYYSEKSNCLILSTSKDLLDKSLSQNFVDSITESTHWQNAQINLAKTSEIKITLIPESLSGEAGYVDYFIAELNQDKGDYVISGKAIGNESVMQEVAIKFNKKQDKKFALYKDIVKENLIFLFESFDLSEEITTAQDIIKIENETLYEDLQTQKDHLKEAASLDFDNDILAWMNDNYLIALHKSNKGMIPDISIIFDIKTAESKANDFFKDANNFAKLWANIAPDFAGKSTYRTIGDSLYAFDFSDILPIFRDNFTFTYGITSENLLIFSTLPYAEKNIQREEHFINIPEELRSGQNLLMFFPSILNDQIKINDIFIKSAAQEYEVDLEGIIKMSVEN